jgi:beta-phosphoglucomutase-like phosphatase (HAD superfamily)
MGDWMRELARHFERLRDAYPAEELCVVFDIDGTIVDTRHLVVHILLAYDRERDTDLFRGLRAEDVTVYERHVDDLLDGFGLPAPVRADVRAFYVEHLQDPTSLISAHRAYPGVLSVIRWFQMQPGTSVALNTGRPEATREATLDALNALGGPHRVRFSSELLMMHRGEWDRGVPEGKVTGLERLRARGLRIVAMVDNEPANLTAMAEADPTGEVLFLHADTLFETPRSAEDRRTVAGSDYRLVGLVDERELAQRTRTRFVWHGVNDRENLRQFLASEVRWAECDVRADPVGRLVARHDGFEERPWWPEDPAMPLQEWLAHVLGAGRAAKLDLKEGGDVTERALAMVDEAIAAAGADDGSLWFNASIETLGETGFQRIAGAHPRSVISAPVDSLVPWLLADARLGREGLVSLASWGVTRASLAWTTPRVREALEAVEAAGWDVNIYGVPDLASFLDAAILAPASVTADFNFPEWSYFGRGSGERGAHHHYELTSVGADIPPAGG